MIKYAIQIQKTSTGPSYYLTNFKLDTKYKKPRITKFTISSLKRKIPDELLFNTKEEARELLHNIFTHIPPSPTYVHCAVPETLRDLSKYSIYEYNLFELEFLKSRKREMMFSTERPKKRDLFCNRCGTQIITKYFKFSHLKICPFCIEDMKEEATNIITEVEKTIPDIRGTYIKQRFLGNI